LDFHFTLACPRGYEPCADVVEWSKRNARGTITITHDVKEAMHGAEVIYTDVWTSMGQEHDARVRKRRFRDYQVNAELLRRAEPDVLVMHCLPAHRGEEITDEVLDGPHSIVLEQAENRLHAQKGLLVWLFAAASPGTARRAAKRQGGRRAR
jgi:ornithine carbamoyltransferase